MPRVAVMLSAALHRTVKEYAVEQGATVTGLTRVALTRFLKERKAEQVEAPTA